MLIYSIYIYRFETLQQHFNFAAMLVECPNMLSHIP